MSDAVRAHYELYPYPQYPLLASIRRHDTYALNLVSLWTRFNGCFPHPRSQRVLIAGCGSFSPYPFAVANPEMQITALDVSARSLGRARLHCLLHGRYSVTFRLGDLLDLPDTEGLYDLIDAFGVLHHLDDPLAGLKALAAHLNKGGILRLMVYSRYARREEESIRRAFRLLRVKDPAMARQMIKRSQPGSRLKTFAAASDEASFDAGLADALLHPQVHTYRIDGLMELIRQSGLEPLLFVHQGAREDVGQEVERIRQLERIKESPGNFIVYLGRETAGPSRDDTTSFVMLNPCLTHAVSLFHLRPLHIPPRLGFENRLLGRTEISFLRRFRKPRAWNTLTSYEQAELPAYLKALFLVQFNP